jgi:hypothetical protein
MTIKTNSDNAKFLIANSDIKFFNETHSLLTLSSQHHSIHDYLNSLK